MNNDTRFANQYNIQWFPGHMTKTLRMMETEIQHVDASLVLLDAFLYYWLSLLLRCGMFFPDYYECFSSIFCSFGSIAALSVLSQAVCADPSGMLLGRESVHSRGKGVS